MFKIHPEIPEALSPDARAFILSCFEPDPHKRATAAELLQAGFLRQVNKGKKNRIAFKPAGEVYPDSRGRGCVPGLGDARAPPSLSTPSLPPGARCREEWQGQESLLGELSHPSQRMALGFPTGAGSPSSDSGTPPW